MNFKPLFNRIVVEKITPEKTKGGIIFAVPQDQESFSGLVKAVGPGRRGVPLDIKVGDIVHFSSYVGQPIELDRKDYLMMNDDDVLAVEN